MKVLILTTSSASPVKYLNKLSQWGIEHEVRTLTIAPDYSKKDLTPEYLDRITGSVYDQFQDSVDAVQILFDRKDWGLPHGIKGKSYFKTWNGYQVGILYDRKGWEDTARHELMHTFDNICRIYIGVELAPVVGVKDWDRDVVHKEPGVYDYDSAYSAIKPYLFSAVHKRRLTGLQNLLQRLLIEYRKLLVSTKPPETLTDAEEPKVVVVPPDEPTEAPKRLYDVAYASLGKKLGLDKSVPKDVNCANALSHVLILAGVKGLPVKGIAGTAALYEWLKKSKDFVEVQTPGTGDIICYPTGYGKPTISNGHIFIKGKYQLMSNNSKSGLWDNHWKSLAEADAYYTQKGGIPRFCFRLIK